MMNPGCWETAKKILCVRLDSMGDVLMSTPAIRALKESVPGRRITLLTSASAAEAAALVPEIDDCIVYDAPWMKATAVRSSSRGEFAMVRRLRERRFDAAVIFTVFSQNPLPSAMLCYLADIPLRLAYCRENPYQLLTHHQPEREPDQVKRHEVRRQLDLAASVGARTADERMRLRVPPGALEAACQLLCAAGVDLGRPWMVVHPGASAPSRRYPAESFAAVAGALTAEDGFQIVFTGNQDECDLIEYIRSRLDVRTFSVAARLSLAELAALLSLAPLLLSNNTGPVHVAAATGTPVVDLYALTNPQHTPWGVPNRVLSYDVPCKFCYRSICPEKHNNCLRLIEPAQVVAACRQLYAPSRAPRPAAPGRLNLAA